MAGLESWGRAQVNVDARGRRRRRGWVCGPLEEGVRACGRDKIGAGRREAGAVGGVAALGADGVQGLRECEAE